MSVEVNEDDLALEDALSKLCGDCGSITIDMKYKDAYGVCVCYSCRSSTNNEDKYECITKTVAKQSYLLSDKDMEQLGFRTVSRKSRQSWGDMKLYLKSQVIEVCCKKYGDMDGLEAEKKRREISRIERRMERNRKKRKRERQSTAVYVEPTRHEHEYGKKRMIDEDNGEWEETCVTCGFTRTFELL